MSDVVDGSLGTHERLRSLVALAHHVPGVRLWLRCRTGCRVEVGNGVDAEVDTDTMRRVVVVAADPLRPDHGCLVDDLEVGGAVAELGAGLFRGTRDDIESRWFVTTLRAPEVDRIVAEQTDGAVEVQVSGDPLLRRTVVGLATTRRTGRELLDLIAARIAATCLALEIDHRSRPPTRPGSN